VGRQDGVGFVQPAADRGNGHRHSVTYIVGQEAMGLPAGPKGAQVAILPDDGSGPRGGVCRRDGRACVSLARAAAASQVPPRGDGRNRGRLQCRGRAARSAASRGPGADKGRQLQWIACRVKPGAGAGSCPSAWWWAAPMRAMQAAHPGRSLTGSLVAGVGVVGDRGWRVGWSW